MKNLHLPGLNVRYQMENDFVDNVHGMFSKKKDATEIKEKVKENTKQMTLNSNCGKLSKQVSSPDRRTKYSMSEKKKTLFLLAV